MEQSDRSCGNTRKAIQKNDHEFNRDTGVQQFSGYLVLVRPDADDAWLFAQINNGNAISLHLSEEYTWTRCENMERTIEKLFS